MRRLPAYGSLLVMVSLGCGPGGASSGTSDDGTHGADAGDGDGDGDGNGSVACQRVDGDDGEWALRCGGPGYDQPSAIAPLPDGNIVVAASTRSEGSPLVFGDFELEPVEGADIVLVELSPVGEVVWVEQIGGPGQQWSGLVAPCGDGIVVTGEAAEAAVDLGDGQPVVGEFVARYDAGRSLAWSRTFPLSGEDGTPHITPSDIECDANGKVAITGRVRGDVDLGAGPLSSPALFDGFVAVYGADGSLTWGRLFQNETDNASPRGQAVAFMADGSLIMAGALAGTVNLGGGPLTGADNDVTLSRFSPLGEHIWTRQIGPEGLQYPGSLAVDQAGLITLGGTFLEGIELGPDEYSNVFPDQEPDIHGTLYDAFLAVWDADGVFIDSTHVGEMLDDRITALSFVNGSLALGGVVNDDQVVRTYDGLELSASRSLPNSVAPSFAFDGQWATVTSSGREPVDFGFGSLAPLGEQDVIIARLRR